MSNFFAAPWQQQIALAALFLALAVSVVTDLRQRLIYDLAWLPALLLSLGMVFSLGGAQLLTASLIGMLICAGPMLLGNLVRVRGKRAMARGDINLMLLTGAVSGAFDWQLSVSVLFWVSVAGGIQAVIQIAWARLRNEPRPEYVPYGVAIFAGTICAFIFGGAFV